MSIENPTLAHFRHLRHFISLYICRERSTNQLLFMQNKPNFPKSQMNLNIYNTMDYENISDWTIGENKPNSNPIKPNFQKAKMNANAFSQKDYRKKDDFIVRINKPNLVRRRRIAKMNANVYVIEDYENEPPSDSKKTNPIQTQFLQRPK
ncbi:MAG: hypothetical protein IIB56_09230 [Planctomycetes bacterium]|nr:hypothetical protein [Planctomycetota bacterium]